MDCSLGFAPQYLVGRHHCLEAPAASNFRTEAGPMRLSQETHLNIHYSEKFTLHTDTTSYLYNMKTSFVRAHTSN
jgi:hypothetical protein